MRLRRIVGVVGAVVLSVGGLAVLPTFLTPAVASPSSGPLFSWGGNIDGELGIGENTGTANLHDDLWWPLQQNAGAGIPPRRGDGGGQRRWLG